MNRVCEGVVDSCLNDVLSLASKQAKNMYRNS